MKRIGLLVAVIVSVVLFTGIQTAHADGSIEGRAGFAERRFLEGMIDHHAMAVMMAQDCLKKATASEVKTLCQNVIDAQTKEITLMQEWLKDWYKTDYQVPTMDVGKDDSMGGMGSMDSHDHTDPSNMMGMMAGLSEVEGREYDIAWLGAMIDHHDDALHMSLRVLKYGVHNEVRDLANKIIAAQTKEITDMEALIVKLSAQ